MSVIVNLLSGGLGALIVWFLTTQQQQKESKKRRSSIHDALKLEIQEAFVNLVEERTRLDTSGKLKALAYLPFPLSRRITEYADFINANLIHQISTLTHYAQNVDKEIKRLSEGVSTISVEEKRQRREDISFLLAGLATLADRCLDTISPLPSDHKTAWPAEREIQDWSTECAEYKARAAVARSILWKLPSAD